MIPRAAYATWLARRYLEETKGGALAPVAVPEAAQLGRGRRGLDYYGARPYEPSDGLKDIFWKHTLKLNQYVVKQRRDDQGEPVLVAVHLAADYAEEADWLAYRLTSAVTLAQDGVPLAFAAYTDAEVVCATPALTPRLAIMQALELIERTRISPRPVRVLEAPAVSRFRRHISRLMASRTNQAVRLARIMSFEYRALQHRAQAHPTSVAIRRAVALLSPPASVLFISSAPAERDIFELTLERVHGLGVHVMPSLSRIGSGTDRTRSEVGKHRIASGAG